MKNIILFIDRDSQEKGSSFLQIIRKRLPDIKMNICRSVASCVTEVNRTKSYMENSIIVLFTHNIDHLDDLYEKKGMLEDKKIVMVLPIKKNHDITSIVNRFSPSYFTYMDDQYDDLCDVLHKMIVQ